MSPLNAVNGQNPRQIAAAVLQLRRPGGHFTEDLLDRALAKTRLATVDRALCQELVYGTVRWQAALDWLIARKTDDRAQNPGLQNLLRLGLYQIFWLDRIPPHAAVHETVELAKQGGFESQAGFVNAVLRGYVREVETTRKLLAELKVSQPAIGWSHPDWLVARWRARWGAGKVTQLLEWNNQPPKTFARVNALKFHSSRGHEAQTSKSEPSQSLLTSAATGELRDAGDLLEQWRHEGVEYDFVRRDWFEENLVFELKSHPPLASLASFREGWFYIQDPGTLLAVQALKPQSGESILDYCAAPGGKTTFLAQLMNNRGRIVAQDVSKERLKLIQENCRRLGVTCAEMVLNDGNRPHPGPLPQEREQQSSARKISSGARIADQLPTIRPLPGGEGRGEGGSFFDRILVDAPCSNTGVMRRRVDLRWRIQPQEISRLRLTQLALLERAAPKLRPGGVLVYSTCSLEPEENSGVVREFLQGHKEFKLEYERELLPFVEEVDGAYVAALKLK